MDRILHFGAGRTPGFLDLPHYGLHGVQQEGAFLHGSCKVFLPRSLKIETVTLIREDCSVAAYLSSDARVFALQKEEAAIAMLKKNLGVLNTYLATHTYLVGNSVTLADIIGASNLYHGFTKVHRCLSKLLMYLQNTSLTRTSEKQTCLAATFGSYLEGKGTKI